MTLFWGPPRGCYPTLGLPHSGLSPYLVLQREYRLPSDDSRPAKSLKVRGKVDGGGLETKGSTETIDVVECWVRRAVCSQQTNWEESRFSIVVVCLSRGFY